MATNLETKNTIERDETKEELAGLKNEVEKKNPIDKRVYLEVDSAFKKFTEQTDARKVRLEKTNDWKLRLITHWETCEFDLKSDSFSFIKWGKAIAIENMEFMSYRFKSPYERVLLQAFGKMDMINKAISISKKHPHNRKFYFEEWNIIQRNNPFWGEDVILKVDWETVAYIWELRKAGFKLSNAHYTRDLRIYREWWDDLLETLNEIVA